MGFWEAYRALTPEQRRILKTKQLSVNRRVDEVMAMLQPIAAYDVAGDKAQKTFGCTAGLCVPLIVVFLIMNANGVFPTKGIGYFTIALFIALFAVTVTIWNWTRGLNVSDNLRQFIVPVLALFREDIDPAAKVNLKLDLSAPTAKEKLQRQSDPYARGSYYKIVDRFYVDPWVTGELPLVDGSTLHWAIKDLVRAQTKTKRNPRGKTKTKTKYSTKSVMDVTLTMRNAEYAVAASDDAKVKEGGKRNSIRVKGRDKRTALGGLEPLPFVDLVAGIYQRATPAGPAR